MHTPLTDHATHPSTRWAPAYAFLLADPAAWAGGGLFACPTPGLSASLSMLASITAALEVAPLRASLALAYVAVHLVALVVLRWFPQHHSAGGAALVPDAATPTTCATGIPPTYLAHTSRAPPAHLPHISHPSPLYLAGGDAAALELPDVRVAAERLRP